MIAYGRNKIKYSIENKAARSDAGCQDYHVKGREETLFARIYDRGLRTREREEEVRMALEGSCGSLPYSPVDMLYVGGRFAGFLYYDYSAETAEEPVDMGMPEEPKPSSKGISMPSGVALLIPVVEAILLSVVAKMLLFPLYVGILANSDSMDIALWLMCQGWLPVLAGGIALAVAYLKLLGPSENTALIAVGGVAAYLLGVAAVFILGVLINMLVYTAIGLVMAVLPVLVGIFVLYIIFKSFLGK